MDNVTPITPNVPVPVSDYRRLSLAELVRNKSEVLKIVEENEGEISQELEEVLDFATDLLEQKVDRVAHFAKHMIPVAREALDHAYKLQKEKIDSTEEWIDNLVKEAIMSQGNDNKGEPIKRIEGIMWRVRVQANAESIEIEDAKKVPDLFKYDQINVTITLPKSSSKTLPKVTLGLEDLRQMIDAAGGEFKLEHYDQHIKKADLKGTSNIEGVKYTKGSHVRYEPGKSSVGGIVKQSKKGKKDAATTEQH